MKKIEKVKKLFDSKEECLEQMEKLASELRRKPTEAELTFGDTCRRNKVPYRFQVPFASSIRFKGRKKVMYTGWIIDYVINDKTAVEIDGGYHSCRHQIKLDTLKDKMLKKAGYNVIRLSNEEANSFKI